MAHLIAHEDVARMPTPGSNAPTRLGFSPNGRLLTYLHSSNNELTQQLYGLDMTTYQVALVARPPGSGNTESNLSLEEKLRRERQRQMGTGITSFLWCPAPHSTRIIYPLQGNLYLQECPGAELTLLFDKSSTGVKGGAIDPQYSPNGRYVAFVQDNEIYVMLAEPNADGSLPTAVQVTTGARESGKSNGLACFVTQEELSRFHGFWWSPDSSYIAFEEIDDTHIPKFRIMHSGSAEVGENAQEDHRYPFAGEANPNRRLGVLPLRFDTEEFQTPVWMDFNGAEDFYISRVNWLLDGSLGVQTLNRLQTEGAFLRFNPLTGTSTTLIEESSEVWLNSHYLFRNLEMRPNGAFTFLWASERSGYMHIYLYEYANGAATCLAQLTSGTGCVEAIEGIDVEHDRLYISGNLDEPTERHLYVTSLSKPGTTPIKLTTIPGVHIVTMDGACSTLVDVYSNLSTPPTAVVYSIGSTGLTPLHTLHTTSDPRLTILQDRIEAPTIFDFTSRDGTTTLHGAIYKPDAAIYGDGPYPTMVNVYGGPHVMRVQNAWSVTVDMRAQMFRAMGYAVLKVDNRGTFRRGLHFEGAIKHAMGTIEISDQEDGVNHCIAQGITVPGRVGIIGWSYGGYMSAISLVKAPETFKLAIAGAPVTSWDGYDTCYTERYMSTPQLNPNGYARGNVMNYVQHMQPQQKLLLIHGLIDENVHFRHTARLINALIGERKHYDLLLFPKERHSPRHLEDRIYMEQRIAEYVAANL
ncbi:dipeptidyl peptidase [Thraustotheca clavata]|uniref:Dipeptidyl peptidase n=1 Tax=Thraustotheca clavata TaxID=74557 RepID=A0A1W0A7J1_9STRA|nr:dipeptidyl peptidase [Thraustotheca clavata]